MNDFFNPASSFLTIIIILITWLALAAYIFMTDRKLRTIERKFNESAGDED
jgi:CcmD family protein